VSTPADVVRDLARLLADLAALLQTQTAREAPAIARDLGAQAQFGQAVAALESALKGIRSAIVPLQHAVISADALVALFGFVPPMVAAIGDAVGSSAEWLAQLGLGLDGAAAASASVTGPIKQVSGVLDIGVDAGEAALALVAPDQWTGVVAGLDHLLVAVAALKNPPPALPA
jgi:hypothetical protein